MKVTPPTPEETLSEERIRRRAYELFEYRGRANGHELDDWLEAEREILEEDQVQVIAAA